MSGARFEVAFDDIGSKALAGLLDAAEDMTDFMDEVGRELVNGAIERIGITNVTPDGVAWQPSRRVEEHGGKTLLDTGTLMRSINAWAAPDHVVVGTNMPQAAVLQFGAVVGALGVWSGIDKRGRQMTVAAPWGDIPARPYIGISPEEAETIEELGLARFERAVRGAAP